MKSAFSFFSATRMVLLLGLTCIKATNALEDLKESLISYNFTTLSAAIKAAGLSDLLYGAAGPLTVFAPTDDAFEALPPGAVEYLLFPENQDLLEDIVLYHVTDQGAYTTDSLTDGQLIVSLLPLKGYVVREEDGQLYIEKSMIEESDIMFEAGVIHGMSQVLIPSSVVFPLDIPETIIDDGNFTTLIEALVDLGLIDELAAPNGPYTVFAPTDDAFKKLGKDAIKDMNNETLSSLLLYHVVDGRVFSSDLEDGMMVPTLNGENLTVSLMVNENNETVAMINDAMVIDADVDALNGVLHYVDMVLVPPAPVTSTPTVAVTDAPSVATTDAPTKAATDAPTKASTDAPTKASTDAPTKADTDVLAAEDDDTASLVPSILDVLNEGENYTTLVVAITAAGLDGLMDGNFSMLEPIDEEVLTLFAPDDDAFASMPPGYLDYLLKPFVYDDLVEVLAYHAANAEISSADIVDGAMIPTLQGENLTATVKDDGSVKINKANVTAVDEIAGNGIIHEISAVLLPKGVVFPDDLVGTLIKSDEFPTLVAALVAAGLVPALRVPEGPYTIFAPSEKAFAKLPDGVLEALLLPENVGTLKEILLYHAIPGDVFAADLEDGSFLITLQGKRVWPTFQEDGIYINTANVTEADTVALNGIIHVINEVLIPPNVTLPATNPPAETAPTDPPVDAPVDAPTGDAMDLPPQLIGQSLGDSKLAASSIGTCAIMDMNPDGSLLYGLRLGWCQDLRPPVVLWPGSGGLEAFGEPELGSEGQVVKYECMECSDRNVFQNRDGTGYAEKYNGYREEATACGKLYLYSEGVGYQCKAFKTSLLVEDTTMRRGLRETSSSSTTSSAHRRLMVSPILVNTMTYGTYKDTVDEVICPSDTVFNSGEWMEVPEAVGTYQLVNQEPAGLLDPTNWYCT